MGSGNSKTEQQLNNAKIEINTLKTQLNSLKSQNTENRQRLNSLTAEYNLTKEQVKSLTDPKKIKENYSKIFLTFLSQLQSFDIYNPIPKEGDAKYVAIIGETSAGKSTIYNKLFGLKLEVGQAEITEKIEIVHQDVKRNRVYFDGPGFNEQIEIINPEILHSFYQIDCVFIVTGTTFKFCKRAIQVMNKINPPHLYLVRTKCDLYKSDAEFEKVKKQDQENLASFEVNPQVYRQVLYISTLKNDSFKDNSKFKKLMKGE